jgi:hypothetical protein
MVPATPVGRSSNEVTKAPAFFRAGPFLLFEPTFQFSDFLSMFSESQERVSPYFLFFENLLFKLKLQTSNFTSTGTTAPLDLNWALAAKPG